MSASRKTKTVLDNDATDAETQPKRKKIRRGTRSCWECKRRKMKCVFDSPTDAVCIACQRRGTKCVSQEFPEEVSAPVDRSRIMGDRVVRVENMVEQLFQKVAVGDNGRLAGGGLGGTARNGNDGGNTGQGILTPASIGSESSRFLALYKPSEDNDNDTGDSEILHDARGLYRLRSVPNTPAGPGKYRQLSRALHEALPSRDDVEMICRPSGQRGVMYHQFLTIPYTNLEQDGLESPESLLEIPGPDVHPVLIARYMLHVASHLQSLHPDYHKKIQTLSEEPLAMMKRLADTAISLVTTNDELLGSIEGLECVMLESLYQSNLGNLRRSWIAARRAMVIAQAMGLHQPGGVARYTVLDPGTKAQPRHMWFRLVFYDRHLCLMLGLPQGSLDRRMASDAAFAADTPMGRLERIHCAISSRVLERNEAEAEAADSSSHGYALTQSLDRELQRAARSLPSKWWLMPDLSAASDPQALFWDTRRMFLQLFHYDLLNQLHLPYMLRSSAGRKYEYSRMTCVNSSREVLSRFITLRRFNSVTFNCRTVDFLVLMAAMTLLLAHLDSHRHRSGQAENLLAHQYLSDRAMMEQAHENMVEITRVSADPLSAQSADLLRRLLAIDAEAADGHTHGAESVSVQTHGTETAAPDGEDDRNSDSIVRVHIPYFGIIKIAREGLISKETPTPPKSRPPGVNTSQPRPMVPVGRSSASATSSESLQRHSGLSGTAHVEASSSLSSVGAGYGSVSNLRTVPRAASNACLEPPGGVPVPSTTSDDNGFTPHWELTPQLPSATVGSDSLLQQLPYPGATAGVDDWAFQGVDMAFFDSLMRGAGDDGEGGAEWAAWPDGS
ncbi:hypothetical protein A1O3_07234 [Capronia epimyces CBS 606.96]|uniref:Zn(2)-C6 fungal-type domain-containing protein n=1 Tax=Capronia epimyces CBS 606.96 TaxID=1182542 RepID=W9XVD6_9EURO|nr:uncharacterized protein A1O3_07234 [Capronia epimyces CBS 606.96]EXJ80946.1 hypothetical protein A1O3_07234 [Capronia epimyces CBS 606.96]